MITVTLPPTKTWPSRAFSLRLVNPLERLPWDAEGVVSQSRPGRAGPKQEVVDYRLSRDGDRTLIASSANPDGEVYAVTPDGSCSCPWGRSHPTEVCAKHDAMATAFRAAIAQQQNQPLEEHVMADEDEDGFAAGIDLAPSPDWRATAARRIEEVNGRLDAGRPDPSAAEARAAIREMANAFDTFHAAALRLVKSLEGGVK